MFRKILCGLDGSAAADDAFVVATRLASLFGAELHVLSVEERLPAYAGTVGEVDEEARFGEHYFQKIHATARRTAMAAGVRFEASIVPGHAAQLLVETARRGGFDLIVIGHTGHSRLHDLFLGSTADRVVERAHCAVLVAR